MNYEDKNKHRVEVLNNVNDAEALLVVTDKKYSLYGDGEFITAMLASAIYDNEAFRGIVIEALERAINYEE